MEQLVVENRKLKIEVESKNLEISELKARLKIETAKYKILTYNIGSVSQSRSSTFEYKKRIRVILELLNLELNKLNYSFDIVTIKNTEVTSPFVINYKAAPDPNIDVDKCLFYKDKISMADHKYISFRIGMGLTNNMVNMRKIKKRKLEINAAVNISPLSTGYYIDPVMYIKLRLTHYLKYSTPALETKNKIWIKLSADGTSLSRNVKIVNFVFSIINEGIKAATATGSYRIAAFKIEKEDYASINEWLPFLWEQMKVLKKINYDPINNKISDELNNSESSTEMEQTSDMGLRALYETDHVERASSMAITTEQMTVEEETSGTSPLVTYEIEHFFSADYKMMSLVLGLQSATSNHPCLICEQNKENLHKHGNL